MTLTEVATQYIGQKELTGNKFDPESDFGKKIKAVGHNAGESWCDLFVEMCCKEATPDKFVEYDKIFTKNANRTKRGFEDKGYIATTSACGDTIVKYRAAKELMHQCMIELTPVGKVRNSVIRSH